MVDSRVNCSYTLYAYLNMGKVDIPKQVPLTNLIDDETLNKELETLISNNPGLTTEMLKVAFPNDFISELNSATTFHSKSKLCTCVGMCGIMLDEINDALIREDIPLSDNAEEFIGDMNYYSKTTGHEYRIDSGKFMIGFLESNGYMIDNFFTCNYNNTVATFNNDCLTMFNPVRRRIVTRINTEFARLGVLFTDIENIKTYSKLEPPSEYKYVLETNSKSGMEVICKQSVSGCITLGQVHFSQLYPTMQEYKTKGEKLINKEKKIMPVAYTTMEEVAVKIVDKDFIISESLEYLMTSSEDSELPEVIYGVLPTEMHEGDFDFMDIYDYNSLCSEVVKRIIIKLCQQHPNTTMLDYIQGYMDYKLDQEKREGDHTTIVNVLNVSNPVEVIPFGVDELIQVYSNILEGVEDIDLIKTINKHLKMTLT